MRQDGIVVVAERVGRLPSNWGNAIWILTAGIDAGVSSATERHGASNSHGVPCAGRNVRDEIDEMVVSPVPSNSRSTTAKSCRGFKCLEFLIELNQLQPKVHVRYSELIIIRPVYYNDSMTATRY